VGVRCEGWGVFRHGKGGRKHQVFKRSTSLVGGNTVQNPGVGGGSFQKPLLERKAGKLRLETKNSNELREKKKKKTRTHA